MLIQNITGIFVRALLVNHPSNMPFDLVQAWPSKPLRTGASTADLDGIYDLTHGFPETANSIILLPFADSAEPGNTFSMRVWGIRRVGPDGSADLQIWLPHLLGEWFCTVCDFPGPVWPGPAGPVAPLLPSQPRYLNQQENLCDTITQTHGVSGAGCLVVSPGSDPTPGPNLPAYIVQDIFGAGLLYFDFQGSDNFSGNMNVLWSRV